MFANICSTDPLAVNVASFSLDFLDLYSAISLALDSVSTTWAKSPAFGVPDKPKTSTGVEGPASWILFPLSSNKALTLPDSLPTTIMSPTLSVPDFTNIVITEPLPFSTFDSITTPLALIVASLFNSINSACNSRASIKLSRPDLVLAETSIHWISPPISSGINSCWSNSVLTFWGLASGLSHLFTATIIGHDAALACLIASTVCGLIPSSAATTKITISVTLAPLALISVNASCPGVSIKEIFEFDLLVIW